MDQNSITVILFFSLLFLPTILCYLLVMSILYSGIVGPLPSFPMFLSSIPLLMHIILFSYCYVILGVFFGNKFLTNGDE